MYKLIKTSHITQLNRFLWFVVCQTDSCRNSRWLVLRTSSSNAYRLSFSLQSYLHSQGFHIIHVIQWISLQGCYRLAILSAIPWLKNNDFLQLGPTISDSHQEIKLWVFFFFWPNHVLYLWITVFPNDVFGY